MQPHSRTGKTDPSPAAQPQLHHQEQEQQQASQTVSYNDGGMSFRPAGAEPEPSHSYAPAQPQQSHHPNHPQHAHASEVTHEYPPPAEAGPLQSSIYQAGIAPGQPASFDPYQTEQYAPPQPQHHQPQHQAHFQHPEERVTPPEPYDAYDPARGGYPDRATPTGAYRGDQEHQPEHSPGSLERMPNHPAGRRGAGSPDAGVHIPELVSGGWQRAPAQQVRLVLVQRDGSDGESFTLTGPTVTIGRQSGDLRFPDDEFLGIEHARVQRTEHGLTVIDLDSINGVFLRISAPEPVYPGDVFLLGHQLLRLENVPESGREQPPRADGVRIFGTPLPPSWGRLVLLGYGGCEAESYFLRPRQVVFGRELGDIVFPTDAFISRRHATLSMELIGESMTVVLEDLQSANGTYLRVRGSAHLEDGDMFRVGDQIFRVRIQ